MNFSNEIKLDGIILSAGKSSRLGTHKAFLDYNGKSFIQNLLEKLSVVCEEIVVVIGLEEDLMMKEIEKIKGEVPLKFATNENYELGMFSSIQCGIRALLTNNFLLIQQVDQPNLPVQFYPEFKSQIEKDIDWLQPSFQNIPGHPIIISDYIKKLIINETPIMSLRELKMKYKFKTKIWACAYHQIHTDIDTLEDYNKLVEENK